MDGSDTVRQAGIRSRWTWAIRDADLDPTTKLVAWALASRMDEDGRCFPRLAQIAADVGMPGNPSRVRRRIRWLEDHGWLVVDVGGGRSHPSLYQAIIPGSNRPPFTSERGVRTTRKGGQNDAERGVDSTPRSNQEVPKEGPASSPLRGSPAPWIEQGLSWQEWAKRTNGEDRGNGVGESVHAGNAIATGEDPVESSRRAGAPTPHIPLRVRTSLGDPGGSAEMTDPALRTGPKSAISGPIRGR